MFKVKPPKTPVFISVYAIDDPILTSEMVLPPSLSSMPSYDEPAHRTVRRGIDPMVPVEMTYDDEFAPSSATLSIDEPNHLETKEARLLMYNKHLLGEGKRIGTLGEVMLEAEKLGCLNFPPPTPPFWIEMSEDKCSRAIASCADVLKGVEEHSEEWLVLNCYLNAVIATEYASKGERVEELTILIGATLRELELVRRNKRDALRGKATLLAAAKGGRMQNAQVSEQTLDLVAYMKNRIEGGAAVAAAARWAFQSNLGSSASANRNAWYRSQRKV